MGKRLVYLFLILRPMDQDTLEQLLERLKSLEEHHGGHDETLECRR